MIFEETEAAQIKSDYDRDGYVRLPGFLDPTSLNDLLKNLDRYIAEVVPSLPNSDVYYEAKDRSNAIRQLIRMSKHDDYFARLMHDSEFTRLAELLLGRNTASRNMQFFNKPAKIGAATPPHQDGHYWMIDPCEGLTMWLALEPVDEENGCVRYTTGSHRKGFRPHGRTDTLEFSQGITDFPNEDDRTNEVVMRAPAR
jgi:phytanoyl-CoA hydroxylase